MRLARTRRRIGRDPRNFSSRRASEIQRIDHFVQLPRRSGQSLREIEILQGRGEEAVCLLPRLNGEIVIAVGMDDAEVVGGVIQRINLACGIDEFIDALPLEVGIV